MSRPPRSTLTTQDPIRKPVPTHMPSDPSPDTPDLAALYERTLSALLPGDSPFVLADFPDHGNIGDSAIYAGEISALDRICRRPPDYVCSWKTYRQDIETFCPEGPILMHGGGNFGDLWKKFHDMRLDIYTRYADRKIIQLPQSIHFSDEEARDRTARVIDKMHDLTLLVRDQHSFDLARRHFNCAVQMCPDSAHMLSARAQRAPQNRVIGLIRLDHESMGDALAAQVHTYGPVVDWPPYSRLRRPPVLQATEYLLGPRLPGSARLMRQRERLYRIGAQRLVNNGFRILSRGESVITDRLHAHILSTLLGKRHIVLDNFYGKISRYMDAWQSDKGLVIRVTDGDTLKSAVERLLAPVEG